MHLTEHLCSQVFYGAKNAVQDILKEFADTKRAAKYIIIININVIVVVHIKIWSEIKVVKIKYGLWTYWIKQ